MRNLMLAFFVLIVPLTLGCATERQYFSNHNPFTDTAIFVAEFFDPPNSDNLNE